jgi:hypothetical protein
MKELNCLELREISGGVASFAYRVGQAIRGAFMIGTPSGLWQFIGEVYYNEQLSND